MKARRIFDYLPEIHVVYYRDLEDLIETHLGVEDFFQFNGDSADGEIYKYYDVTFGTSGDINPVVEYVERYIYDNRVQFCQPEMVLKYLAVRGLIPTGNIMVMFS